MLWQRAGRESTAQTPRAEALHVRSYSHRMSYAHREPCFGARLLADRGPLAARRRSGRETGRGARQPHAHAITQVARQPRELTRRRQFRAVAFWRCGRLGLRHLCNCGCCLLAGAQLPQAGDADAPLVRRAVVDAGEIELVRRNAQHNVVR
eukprot:1596937-Prymnesium_polylepis.1